MSLAREALSRVRPLVLPLTVSRHVADVTDDLGMPVAQAGEPFAIEDIDPANRIGDDVVLVAAAIEQRHLAEEIDVRV